MSEQKDQSKNAAKKMVTTEVIKKRGRGKTQEDAGDSEISGGTEVAEAAPAPAPTPAPEAPSSAAPAATPVAAANPAPSNNNHSSSKAAEAANVNIASIIRVADKIEIVLIINKEIRIIVMVAAKTADKIIKIIVAISAAIKTMAAECIQMIWPQKFPPRRSKLIWLTSI